MRPQSNGLVELHDAKGDRGAFMCLDLLDFLNEDGGNDWARFHGAFVQARSGNCPYRDKCKRYERTVKKGGHQLKLF